MIGGEPESMSRRVRSVLTLSALHATRAASAFDHGDSDRGAVLQAHDRWSSGGHASTVDHVSLKR